MFRSLTVFAAAIVCSIVAVVQCNHADAQVRWRGSNSPRSSFGFSIGVGSYPGYGYSRYGYSDPYRFDGYTLDPYRNGRFQAPDLLDDPYFREQHRYESRFPGRRSHRTRSAHVIRPTVPRVTYESHPHSPVPTDRHDTHAVPVDRAEIAGQLQSSAQQLLRSLSSHQHSDAWLQYLAPDQISQWIANGDSTALRELLTHYDGVVGNPQLHSIAATDGFSTTRSMLRQYVDSL